MEKLFDSELRVMKIVWEYEPVSAKKISLLAAEKFKWNKNTTYTVIKRLIDKGILIRNEPDFICTSVFKEQDFQKAETKTLIEKLFNGSRSTFFATFADEKLLPDEIDALRALIEKKE